MRTGAHWIAVALALAAASLAPRPLRPASQADLLFASGTAARQRGQLEQAQRQLERLLQLEPGRAEGWYQLGLARAAQGDYGGAVDAYRLALGRVPDLGPAQCALALALREKGRHREALESVERGIQLLPAYAGARNLKGNLLHDLGRDEEALGAYQTAVALHPGYANAHFNQGVALASLGRRREAKDAFGAALGLAADMGEAWLALGGLQLEEGGLEQASQSFNRALRSAGCEADAQWGLARVAGARGDRAEVARRTQLYKAALRRRDAQASRAAQELHAYQPSLALDAAGGAVSISGVAR